MPEQARLTSETAQAIAAGMPACPNCGGRNVRQAHAIRLEDTIRAWFRYSPYRCRTCQNRFYKRPKLSAAPAETSNVAKAG
jgi:transposase-like protein